jgi:uncharacterized protein involved in exopolysaccharide biosynthesis
LKQARLRANVPAAERAERYRQDLAELRAKAEAAQDKVTAFRKENGLPDVEGGPNDVETTALADLEAKLLAAQNDRRKLESQPVESSPEQMLDNNDIQGIRGKLIALQEQMAPLLTSLGPRHPKVVELQSEINATRRALDAEVESIRTNRQAAIVHARELEGKFQAAVDAQRARAIDHRALLDTAGKLLVELQSAKATYERALEGYGGAEFAAATDNADVSLISRADPPAKADKPNKMKLFAMACLAGLGLGLGWPFGYELVIDRRLRCRDDLERGFRIPVLAQLGPIDSRA